MKIINLVQGSPEWLEYRRSHIGSSDSPSICGVGFKTAAKLFDEKYLDERPFVSDAMRKGSDGEDAIRKRRNSFGFNFQPIVFESTEHPWMCASLDGWDDSYKEILEIKRTNAKSFREYAERLPDHYLYQVQHQMCVTNCDSAFLICECYETMESFEVSIPRDEKIIEEILEKGKEFWDSLQVGERPKGSLPDREDLFSQISKLRELQILKTSIEKQEKELRKLLIVACDGESFQSRTLKFEKSSRKGAVDYDAIPELDGVDLEKYRKAPTVIWRLS